jgi:hypothetical protein
MLRLVFNDDVAWATKYLIVHVVLRGTTSPNTNATTACAEGAIGDLGPLPCLLAQRAFAPELEWFGNLADGSYTTLSSYHLTIPARRLMIDGIETEDCEVNETVYFRINYLPRHCLMST